MRYEVPDIFFAFTYKSTELVPTAPRWLTPDYWSPWSLTLSLQSGNLGSLPVAPRAHLGSPCLACPGTAALASGLTFLRVSPTISQGRKDR